MIFVSSENSLSINLFLMYVSIIVFQNSVRHGPAEVFWVSPDTGIAYVHMIVDFVYDFYAMLTYLALPV